jgi:lipoprotein-anchoring transpeptidase ErfK/SrfK
MQGVGMADQFSRRMFLGACAGLFASAGEAAAQNQRLISDVERLLRNLDQPQPGPAAEDEQYFDSALLPPPESEIDFPIEPVSISEIAPRNRPQVVDFQGSEPLGSIVIDPDNRFLYHVLAYGQAQRYGVGVGRAGFAWSGVATVGMKRRWPRWVPPRAMVNRDPRARKWMNGQPGGPDNPLGARALYLFADGRDTLYRIQGTNETHTIGQAVSSGCIRMLNQDVAELFERVMPGTIVQVRPSQAGQV